MRGHNDGRFLLRHPFRHNPKGLDPSLLISRRSQHETCPRNFVAIPKAPVEAPEISLTPVGVGSALRVSSVDSPMIPAASLGRADESNGLVLQPGRQQDLFPLQDSPDRLLFEPEIMTGLEEIAFLGVIKELPFGSFRMHGVDAKRRVVRFGAHYLAGSAEMRPASEFPLPLEPLQAHSVSESLVTGYPPVAAIGWHRDSPPFGIVAGVSLGGA
jgi:hypothetical protein